MNERKAAEERLAQFEDVVFRLSERDCESCVTTYGLTCGQCLPCRARKAMRIATESVGEEGRKTP